MNLERNFLYSSINKIGVPLVPVIIRSCIGTVCLIYDPIDNYLKLLVCCVLVKTLFHACFVEFLKTFHPVAVCHHYYTLHYLLFIFSNEFQTEKK